MRLQPIFFSAFTALFLVTAPQAQAADGMVKKASGTATILHQDVRSDAKAGTPVVVDDLIETGPDGSVGITLSDNTTLSLGPNSAFTLEDFDFDPKADKLGLTGNMKFGTLAFNSGDISKLAPGKVSLKTPLGTIGLRGTAVLVKIPK